jgi:hypothetical protein
MSSQQATSFQQKAEVLMSFQERKGMMGDVQVLRWVLLLEASQQWWVRLLGCL